MHQLVECNQTQSGRERIRVFNHTQGQQNFPTKFVICKNFPYEVIIDANFLKANKILLDVVNSKFVYPMDTKAIIDNIQAIQIKENISNMKEYRLKQIQEISNLWKKLASRDNRLNLINKNNTEKYYGFLVRKTKIPPKSMQSSNIVNARTH